MTDPKVKLLAQVMLALVGLDDGHGPRPASGQPPAFGEEVHRPALPTADPGGQDAGGEGGFLVVAPAGSRGILLGRQVEVRFPHPLPREVGHFHADDVGHG